MSSDNHPEDEDKVCLGVIIGARGLKGVLRIKSFTAEPTDVGAYGPLSDEAEEKTFELNVEGQAKGVVLAKAAGVSDRTAAEKLKGTRLYASRAVLPPPDEDEYYHSDLVGLRAEAPAGHLGTVRAVHDFGAGDVLELAGGDFGTVLVPFTKAAVPLVDLQGGRVVIDPPDGLLEPPEYPQEGHPQEGSPEAGQALEEKAGG